MLDRLEDKVIIVAGSGGIGGELARRFAAEGAAVVLGDIDREDAAAVADEITARGGRAAHVHLDGTDDGSIADAVALAGRKYGGLDGFHANFGIFRTDEGNKDVLDMPMDTYDKVMQVNARGFVLCTRRAVPALRARGGGTMLYTSSGVTYMGEPVRTAYSMSKLAIHALMRHVATRFGPEGIRANVIAPGVILHEGIESAIPADILRGYLGVTKLKTRLGRPSDIAAMAALLFSDEGAFITGQVISIDGGAASRT